MYVPVEDFDADFLRRHRSQLRGVPEALHLPLARKLRAKDYSTADVFELRSRDDHDILRAYVIAARDIARHDGIWIFPHLWTWRSRQEALEHIEKEPELAEGLSMALLYEAGVIDEPVPEEEAPQFVLANLFKVAFQYVLSAPNPQHYNFVMNDVATCLEYAGQGRAPHLACTVFVDTDAGRAFTLVYPERPAAAGDVLLRAELTPMPDYSQDEYWDGHYRSTATPFDWYVNWPGLRVVFEKHVPRSDRILNLGCGNSLQPFEMARDGWTDVQSFDISPTAVAFLAEHVAPAGSPAAPPQAALDFLVADARRLPYRAASFDVVFDKGGLDGLMYKPDAPAILRAIWDEARRVLAPGGRFILVTVGNVSQRLDFVEGTLGWTVADAFKAERGGKAYWVLCCTPEPPAEAGVPGR